MAVIDLAPASIPAPLLAKTLRLAPGAAGEGLVQDVLQKVLPLLHPRAFIREAYIEAREETAVTIGAFVFRSRVLKKNLEGTRRVFPFLITVGAELEQAASRQVDLLLQYQLETAADLALQSAGERLAGVLAERYGAGPLSSMSPGSLEDWPLQEQKTLFALLGDMEAALGVRLTDSLLMLPRKSISGIFFPAEETFTSCRLCPRPKCQGRKAAFEPEARRSFGLGEGDDYYGEH